jgi:glycosyltransferase involved in cell wall biosynthesis
MVARSRDRSSHAGAGSGARRNQVAAANPAAKVRRVTPLVSIVLNSYNYERYVETAIDSALAQRYPEVEVIVVDDGSTDGSWEKIASYDDRARTIRKRNGGQASTVNAGYDASTGEIVIFLDSDDFLHPDAADAVVAAWVEDCCKVQYRLSIVDEHGERTGAFPAANVTLPSGDLVPVIAANGGYVWPVTTGNAYNRAVLEQLMPIPEVEFRGTPDGYLNPLVPFFGPVISLQRELGAYRMHGSNLWLGRTGVEQMRKFIEHDWLKQRYTHDLAVRQGRALPGDLAILDWQHVLHRLSHLRLDPVGHPVATDTRLGLARAGVRAAHRTPELAGAERLFYAAVFVALAVVPASLAPTAVRWANTSKPRPAWMRWIRRTLRAIRLPGRSDTGSSAVA